MARLERSKRIVFGKDIEESINPDNLKLIKRYKMNLTNEGKSAATIYNYERDLLNWLSYVNVYQDNVHVKDLEMEDIEEFIFFCREQGNNNDRINRRLSVISPFYEDFLMVRNYADSNPTKGIKRPQRGLPVEKKVFLTKEQVEKIREWLKEEDDLQLTTYFELSIATMARVNAVSNLTWNHIDYEMGIINDIIEKGQEPVKLMLTDHVQDLLKQLYKQREEEEIDSEYIFLVKYGGSYSKASTNNMRGWAKRIGEVVDEPELSPHDFRRTGATLRSHAGQPFEQISSLLNHKGLDVTKRYIQEDLAKKKAEFNKYEI